MPRNSQNLSSSSPSKIRPAQSCRDLRPHKLLSFFAGIFTALAVAGVSLWGCGSPSPDHLPAVSSSSGDRQRSMLEGLAPLHRAVTVEAVRGTLQTREGSGPWKARREGQSLTGLTELRARGQGVMLSVGGTNGAGEQGKLWLRGGALLRVGQAGGVMRLALAAGEARVSFFDHTRQDVQLLRQGRFFGVAGEDLLLRAEKKTLKVLRTARRPLVADWTLALQSEPAAAGLGTLAARGGVASLELRRVWVKAKTAGDFAETSVEHVFYNTSSERLEGTFRFPLPAGASLLGLAMEINGELMEGELVERHKARRTYESIVDSMQDPALLEWEQGNTFKLRVFPIEGSQEKRIIIRYLAPLRGTTSGYAYSFETSIPDLQQRGPAFRLDFEGRTVVDEEALTPGRRVSVPLPTSSLGTVHEEIREDGVYRAVRIRPDWSNLNTRQGKGRVTRDMLLVMDTSRSSLESRSLALRTMQALLKDLHSRDRFLVLAADLTVRGHAPGFVPATRVAVEEAVAFIGGIEPDGATDLGLALEHAGRLIRGHQPEDGRQRQVIYIGDGTATWGETEPATLKKLAARALGEQALHAVVLGKGADSDLLGDLAAQQGGVSAEPRSTLDVQRFALILSHAAGAPRLRDVVIRAGENDRIYPRRPVSLLPGDELVALVHTPTGEQPPAALTLRAVYGGRPLTQVIPTQGTSAAHVAHRWARQHIAFLQGDGAAKEAIIQQSLRYGVMSRHTALLVLESEEAYKRHQIARRNKPADKPAIKAPRVSGGDLESVAARQASMSPDHMQPGDPEIRIPAPADASAVVVVFPFGVTKVARYEPDLKAWTVRFLINKDTPDGTYQVTVRITHQDGRVEVLPLSYVVDTRGPRLKLSITRHRRDKKTFIIAARQVITRIALHNELRRMEIAGQPVDISEEEAMKRYALLVRDAHRVEVRVPGIDGPKVLRMWPASDGTFYAWWRPNKKLRGATTLEVIAVDRAYNRTRIKMTFDPSSGVLKQERLP